MLNITPVFWIKLICALLIGFGVARQLRSIILSIVFRMLPIKYRMSDSGFHKHTRLSTIIGISLLLGTAGFCWFVFSSIERTIQPHKSANTSINDRASIGSSATFISDTYTADIPAVIEDKTDIHTQQNHPNMEWSTPNQLMVSTTQEPSLETQYYLQLNAFAALRNAQKLQGLWHGKMIFTCWISSSTDDATPYKVLLGPFPSRAQAVQIRKRYNSLKGSYVKSGEGLAFFQQAHRSH